MMLNRLKIFEEYWLSRSSQPEKSAPEKPVEGLDGVPVETTR